MSSVQFGLLAALIGTLMVPGLLCGATAGLRGWLLVGAAPVLTYGLIAIAAPTVPAVLGTWSPAGFVGCTAVICLILLGVRALTRLFTGTLRVPNDVPTRWTPVQHVAVALVVLATTALGLFVVAGATGSFAAVHQFWDAILHANAIRFIADTGQSDPAAMRNVGPDVGTFFYPNAFHVHTATAFGWAGGPLVELLNLRAGLTAGVFCLSMVTLVRQTSPRPALALAVAAVCGAFSAFPHDLIFFGPLWPFTAGLTLLPAFLALLVRLLNSPHPATVAVTALGMVGLTALHPSVALAAAILGVAFLAQRWITLRRIPLRDAAVLAASAALAAGYVLPVLAQARQARAAGQAGWPAVTTWSDALGQLLLLKHEATNPQLWLIVAMAIGIVGIGQLGPLIWWLAGGAVFVGLFVLAAAFEGPLVSLLTDPWWNDRWRFVALATPALVLLAANGLVVLRDLLLRLTIRPLRMPAPIVRAAGLVLVLAALAVATEGLYNGRNIDRVAHAYQDGPMLDGREQAALAELSRMAPPKSLIMNDSNDGTGWMWAIHDLRPVFGHALPMYGSGGGLDADRTLLYNHFDELDTNPAVRDTVRRMGIEYVMVGAGFASGESVRAPGLDRVDFVPGLRKVFQNGSAWIYRIELDQRSTQ